MKTVIVYGPPACGKTRNASRIAAFFGIEQIVDDWDHLQHEVTIGAIHLTNRLPTEQRIRCVEFSKLKLPPIGRRTVNIRPRSKRRYDPSERASNGGAA